MKYEPSSFLRFEVLIDVQRISVGLVFVFVSPLHCFLKLLFENAIAILHRAQLLREDLFAHLFLLVQAFDHLVKRRERLCLLFMGDESAGLRVDRQVASQQGQMIVNLELSAMGPPCQG